MQQERTIMGRTFRIRLGVVGMVVLLVLLAVSPVLAQSTITIRTTDNINLRAAPETHGRPLAVVPYGTALTAVAISADGLWLSAAYDGVLGWVALDYVTVEEGALSDLPVSAGSFAPQPVVSDGGSLPPVPPNPDGDIDALFGLWESIQNGETVVSDSPDDLVITEPASGSDLPSGQVRMSWQAVTGAVSYRIEVYSDQSEVTYTASYRTTGTSINIPTSEIPGRSLGWGYWIEVSALDKDGSVIAQGSIWVRRVVADATPVPSSGGGPRGPRP